MLQAIGWKNITTGSPEAEELIGRGVTHRGQRVDGFFFQEHEVTIEFTSGGEPEPRIDARVCVDGSPWSS